MYVASVTRSTIMPGSKFRVRAILLVDFDPNSIVTGEGGIRDLLLIVPLCDSLLSLIHI